jgi:hypothetical protein
MSAHDNLSAPQFIHEETDNEHVITASSGGMAIGQLSWQKNKSHGYGKGEISGVFTNPANRRQGVATGMYNEGAKYSPKPVHSGNRTNAGNSWARSTTGAVPDRPRSVRGERWNGEI